MTKKPLYFCFIMWSLYVLPIYNLHADSVKAQAYLQDISDKVISILTDKNSSDHDIQNNIALLLDENFEFNLMSNFLLARYAKTIDDQTKTTFVDAVKNYAKSLYAHRFREYKGETLTISEVQEGRKNTFVVKSLMERPSHNTPIYIDWRIIQQNDGFKIFDIIVNDISMVLTQREEFQSYIKQHNGNVQALTDLLNERVASAQ